jgi:phosphoserine aminotransferase
MLHTQVLEEAQRDLVNYKGTGMSIMEMSHRGKEYEAVIRKAEADLRKLLSVPDNYKILFLQGAPTIFCNSPDLPLEVHGQLQPTCYPLW